MNKENHEMFNEIAPTYDLLNHIFSFGIDKWWRRRVFKKVKKLRPSSILDCATGTGDLALSLSEIKNAKVTALDPAKNMLRIAKSKDKKNALTFKQGFSESLPFKAKSFDVVTLAFGVRNFKDRKKGLTEIHRVLKSGGHLLILEFAWPRFPLNGVYNLYFKTVIPFLGGLISKKKSAYTYLYTSVKSFPKPKKFMAQLSEIGFTDIEFTPLNMGIAAIYLAQKK